jgi:hypothetical protein
MLGDHGQQIESRLHEPVPYSFLIAVQVTNFLMRLKPASLGINEFATEVVIGACRRGVSQHHDCVARGTHQIVAFFDDLSIAAVVESELFKLII